jgi:hypothetical protein
MLFQVVPFLVKTFYSCGALPDNRLGNLPVPCSKMTISAAKAGVPEACASVKTGGIRPVSRLLRCNKNMIAIQGALQ